MTELTRRSLLSIAASSGAGLAGTAAHAGAPTRQVDVTLYRLYDRVPGSRALVRRAYGVLVFPTVIKAGFGLGGEYGDGVLLVRNRVVGFYNCISGSIGFQLGAQARSVVILFMTEESFAKFQHTDGWKVGVDGSVALITIGVGGSVDTDRIISPVVGFIFDGAGLMYNLTLEGTKISRISGW